MFVEDAVGYNGDEHRAKKVRIQSSIRL